MNRRGRVFRRWRDLGITTKFTTAFGLLLALMALIAALSVGALILVRRETENAIVTSTEIQRLVLEMDAGLQEARRLEKDFFWRYPTIGYSVAFQTYAEPAQEQIARVRALSAELQRTVSEANVSDAWRESDVNLNLYLSAAGRHAATVEEAAALVARLAADEDASTSEAVAEISLQAQLAAHSSLLENTLRLADDSALMVLYREMQAYEKDYLLARQRPFMQSAFNAAIPLREAIESVATLEADQKARALGHLDNYLAAAKEILELDAAIESKFNEFDLQAEAVDPISAELIALADQEVTRARARINGTNRLVTGMVVVAALMGLASAFGIAQVLNKGITRNVVTLTQAAGELQAGNLQVRARIESADEIGQLAGSFNDMATRISDLVGSLEQKVAARTEALRQERDFAESLIDTAQAIVLVLDTEGHIVRFNPFMEEISGYRLEEVQGKDWFSILLPTRDYDEIRALFQQAVGDVQTRGNQNPIVTKDGHERIIEWNDKTLKDADGNVVGLLAIGQDITERVRATEALRESEEKYRAVVQQSLQGIVIAQGPPPRLVFANPAFAEMLGYTTDELTSLSPDQTIGLVHPEDQEMFFKRFQSRLEGKPKPPRYEFRANRKDGRERWLEIYATRVEYEGQPAVQAAFVDITERKRAEAELREHREHLEELVAERTADLRKMVNAMAGREVRMAELKGVIRELRAQLEEAGLEPVADDPLLGS